MIFQRHRENPMQCALRHIKAATDQDGLAVRFVSEFIGKALTQNVS